MQFLTTVLTSGRFDLLKKALSSIPSGNDVHIICNTLDSDYRKQLDNSSLARDYRIVHTESNGLAGAGQQSVLDHFLTTKYSHLIRLDGDDCFFEEGHQKIRFVMNNNPDINVLTLIGEAIQTEAGKTSYRADQIDLRRYVESEFHNLTVELAEWMFDLSGYTGDDEYWFERLVCVDKKGAAIEKYDSLTCNCEDIQMHMKMRLLAHRGEIDYRQMFSTECYLYNKFDGFGASDAMLGDPKTWRQEVTGPFTEEELELINQIKIPKV